MRAPSSRSTARQRRYSMRFRPCLRHVALPSASPSFTTSRGSSSTARGHWPGWDRQWSLTTLKMRAPHSCVVRHPSHSGITSILSLAWLRLFAEPGGDDRVSRCHDDRTDEDTDESDGQYAADHADEYDPQRNVGAAADQQGLDDVVEYVDDDAKHGREQRPAGLALIGKPDGGGYPHQPRADLQHRRAEGQHAERKCQRNPRNGEAYS